MDYKVSMKKATIFVEEPRRSDIFEDLALKQKLIFEVHKLNSEDSANFKYEYSNDRFYHYIIRLVVNIESNISDL